MSNQPIDATSKVVSDHNQLKQIIMSQLNVPDMVITSDIPGEIKALLRGSDTSAGDIIASHISSAVFNHSNLIEYVSEIITTVSELEGDGGITISINYPFK